MPGFTGRLRFGKNGFPKLASYGVHSTTERGNTSSELVAEWRSDVGHLETFNDRLFLNTFSDFGGRVLKIATQEVRSRTFVLVL